MKKRAPHLAHHPTSSYSEGTGGGPAGPLSCWLLRPRPALHLRSLCLLALLLGLVSGLSTPALAQRSLGFHVDGDPEDWGGPPGNYTARHNVQPVQVNSIDMRAYNLTAGVVYRDAQDQAAREPLLRAIRKEWFINPYWEYTFLLRFVGPVFGDPVESTVEFLVDMDADQPRGEATGPWKDFRPDYRLEVAGQDGRITRIAYFTWDGAQWQPWPDPDLKGIEVAASGRILEGAVSLSVLGSPRIAPDELGPTVQTAFRTTQGESHDYLPFKGEFVIDDADRDQWLPFRGTLVVNTVIDPRSWGWLKRARPGVPSPVR